MNYPNYRLPPLCLETVSADAGKDTAICPRKTIVIGSQPAAGLSCRWTPSASLSGSTSCRPFASPDTTTTYILEVYAENCPSAFDTITVTVLEETAAPCTSISRTATLEPEISIYPNPADASVSITFELGGDIAGPALEVFDLIGRMVWSETLEHSSGRTEVETSSWSPGLYVFRLNGWALKVLIAR